MNGLLFFARARLLLWRAVRLRCLACGKAKFPGGVFNHPKQCLTCGYFYERETGYFLPHVVIGYAGTVAVTLGAWQFLERVLGIHRDAVVFPTVIGIAIIFSLWFARYAKTLWIALDLSFHPPVSEDFQPRGR